MAPLIIGLSCGTWLKWDAGDVGSGAEADPCGVAPRFRSKPEQKPRSAPLPLNKREGGEPYGVFWPLYLLAKKKKKKAAVGSSCRALFFGRLVYGVSGPLVWLVAELCLGHVTATAGSVPAEDGALNTTPSPRHRAGGAWGSERCLWCSGGEQSFPGVLLLPPCHPFVCPFLHHPVQSASRNWGLGFWGCR